MAVRDPSKFEKMKKGVISFCQTGEKLAQDDIRRIVHSLKVGLAITLVSLFYYFEPLYDGFGVGAMWAVLTVVVVFEYSVGATLGKGANRAIATGLAAMLAFGLHRLSSLFGSKSLPYFIAIFVFLIAASVTFLRFFPQLKPRYDYGLMVFILTFALISVSGYRDDQVFEMAHKRISTILIGSATAFVICVLICPVWAGTDLHNLVTNNIEKLGNFLEEFGEEYFRCLEDEKMFEEDKKIYMEGYTNVLDSVKSLETLVNFANWEPRHGKFRYRHPWAQYQKTGILARHCACRIDALNGYLHADNQAPQQVKNKIEEPCKKMIIELGKALKELASSIEAMTHPSNSAKSHMQNSKSSAESLNAILRVNPWKNIKDATHILPAASVASLLLDIVGCTNDLFDAVEELASLAHFKKAPKEAVNSASKTGTDECKGKPPKLAQQGSFLRRTLARGSSRYLVVNVGEDDKVTSSPRFSTRYKDPAALDMPQQDGE